MNRNFSSLLLYTFGFLLLWEWLRPIEQLTETNYIETFIFFLLVAFAVTFVQLKWIWQFMIKLLFILYAINHFHYDQGFLHFSWLKAFFTDIVANVELIVSRNWNNLTNEFRTFLFFILLWLMVYLIHYWLLKQQRIFIFFFMTLVYISVLDTFTPYDAKAAIVRTVVAGFTVMGLLTFYRIMKKENVTNNPTFLRKWMVPLAGVIAFSVLLGIAAPKAAPIWPDPVPFFTADNSKGEADGDGIGRNRVGYGTNDSALGGPFIGDPSPVFRYEANGKNYWKMETKDRYTGKGWLVSGSTNITFSQNDLVPVSTFPEIVETIKESASVETYANYNYNFIMYPAGIKKLIKILPLDPRGSRFELDIANERIGFYTNNNRPVVPESFTVDYEIPKYKASDLTKTTSIDTTSNNLVFYEKYTQLPDELPPRIKQLAEEITVGKTNWFDKAKAVENYFGNNGYSYDQKNVAVPDTNDDYVDQFLFDTKRGYCDNFSSSMVVMLRTLGIPTRWVKGFTGGDFSKYSDGESSKQFYEVTNNNAHSWVEVFFSNQGWVPFEPTKGFSNELLINDDVAENQAPNQPTTPAPVQKPQKEEPDDTKSPEDSKKSFDVLTFLANTNSFLKNNWKQIVLMLILVVGLTAIFYRIRGKWVPYLVLILFRFKKKDESIASAYLQLLKQLDRFGLKRKDNQTLRNYARYIDTFFSTREMTRLTAFYEQYMYQQSLPQGTWKESYPLWENLIKKTIT
jgi:transglutaminase-like putative cysteine protease